MIATLLLTAAVVYRPAAVVRVDQVGYVADASKRAVLLASGPLERVTFRVLDSSHASVLTATSGPRLGAWSKAYPRVYALDFSVVTTPGTYTIEVGGRVPASSPSFRIATASDLYAPLLANASFFYRGQRDGGGVDTSVMGRQPSHLVDAAATVYAPPKYADGVLQGSLTPVGGSIDVSGGWFDAGDYIKLVETASYTEAMMLLAVRDHPTLLTGGPADFATEARFGLDWLRKMWDDGTRTLHYQVGLGDGNGSTILGDHDSWRRPEEDDLLAVAPGDPGYYVKYRPVFRAGAPGSKLSPNLAGRLAVGFALCYQVFKATDVAYANECLLRAEHVFDLAKTASVGQLTTAAPYDYYPETEWRDDMELGAVELYFATAGGPLPPGLPHSDPVYYLGLATHWARAYIAGPGNGADTLNLYDVSGLAHFELHRALTAAGDPPGLEVTGPELLDDIRTQLDAGVRAAALDPFGLGVAYDGGDAAPHALGLALLASFHHELTGNTSYDAFGLRQIDWLLGANAWGASFVVGAGGSFPACLHHQVANLAGSLDRTPPVLLGATVGGPNAASDFTGLTPPDGARACPPAGGDAFRRFSGRGAVYQDGVSAYPSVEPADDYTAPTVLLFAREAAAPLGIPLPIWTPPPSTTWQWQLSGLPVDTSIDGAMYDVDAFDNDAAVVASLHGLGRKVVCYLSAGSWENWRPDASRFPPAVLGTPLDGWPGERWLDVRQTAVLGPIMEARLDLCRSKGFDGVEADNVDGYANASGFPLTASDQLRYNQLLADAAHARGLSIGLKNDLDQVVDLLPSFDWALNEECFAFAECGKLSPFVAAGKAVFNVEYALGTAQFCPQALVLGFNSMKKNLQLDAKRDPCW